MTDTPKPISRRVRFEVLRRDEHTCYYCGAKAPDVPLTVDHVVPRALGGSNDPSNLVAACRDCNNGKASTSPDEHVVAAVADDAVRFAAALERAAETRRSEIRSMTDLVNKFDQTWSNWKWTDADGERRVIDREPDWKPTVDRFITLGLDSDDLAHLVEVAMRARKVDSIWRYFCGCCWTEITRRQDIARADLSAPPADDDDESPEFMAGYADGFDDGLAYGRQWRSGVDPVAAYEEGVRAGIRRATTGEQIPAEPQGE